MGNKKTKLASEPPGDNSTDKLTKMILCGRWLPIKRIIKKGPLPPKVEKIFMSQKVPKKLYEWYVKHYLPGRELWAISTQPDKSPLLHCVCNEKIELSLRELRQSPKGWRYLVMEAYYKNHDLSEKDELFLIKNGRATEILIYLKFHTLPIYAALALVDRGLIRPIRQMAKKELPFEVFEAMKESTNPQIAALTQKITYKTT